MQIVAISQLALVLATVQLVLATRRQPLSDPLYSLDDVDYQIVSARSQQTGNQPTIKSTVLNQLAAEPNGTSRQTSNSRGPAFDSLGLGRQKKSDDQSNRHWSALESYYQKLRAVSNQQHVQPTDNPIYVLRNNQQQQQQIQQQQIQQQQIQQQQIQQQQIQQLENDESIGLRLPFTTNSNMMANLPSPNPKISPFNFPLGNVENRPTGSQMSALGTNRPSLVGMPRSGSISPEQRAEIIQNFLMSQQSDLGRQRDFWARDDRVKESPEFLLVQQDQQRLKHQKETFGPWYDIDRTRELLREEAFCGRRNDIRLHELAGLLAQSPVQSVKSGRLHLPLSGLSEAQLHGLGLQVSPAEFPSHVAIYDSAPSDENFLCAGVWVHDAFVLTVASCVQSRDPKRLQVRLGEWSINNNSTSNSSRPMITKHVRRLIVSDKLQNSSIHNVALLELEEPVDFLTFAYLTPACLVQSRSRLRANSCWTPVRTTITSEHIDYEGGGETKERRTIVMVEQPVKLVANDESECTKLTGVEYFNFNNPNFICSADYKKAPWRLKLNQTEAFGSGIYCNEGGTLSLVSIVHPINAANPSAQGYLDLSYYRPWIRNVILGQRY